MRGARTAAAPAVVMGLVLVLGLAGCGPGATPSPATTASPSPATTASPSAVAASPAPSAAPASPVTGVLLGVTSEGLNRVRAFRLRTSDGQEIDFAIGTLENGVEFPPGHLGEHLASSTPVRVYFRAEGERLVVYRIEDASP